MILNRIGQITGGAAMIPPLPKAYDVEKPRAFQPWPAVSVEEAKKTKATPNVSATYDVEGESPE